MSKLFYTYSTMSAGKSLEIIKVAYNYQDQNKPVLIMNSSLDSRAGKGFVWSRTGFKMPAINFNREDNIKDIVLSQEVKPLCLLIDEAQFLEKGQVLQLTELVDDHGIVVMCYGLKNDSFNSLFEGSKHLLVYADKITELKTECWFCNKKATMNLRFDENGDPVYSGEQIEIGGNERYLPVCRKCHKIPKKVKKTN